MKTRILLLLLTCFTLSFAKTFSTEGNGLRHVIKATVAGKDILYISELDGALGAFTTDGEKLWYHPSVEPAVMFELVASDIDADGNDELLAASGDGNIYCYTSKGKLKWKFNPDAKVRFSEVAVVNNGKVQIFAGANDYLLYELDQDGNLVGHTKVEGIFRKLESGHFLDANKESLLVYTYMHDKFRWQMMAILDADTKEIKSQIDYKKADGKIWSSLMVTDVDIADIDKDGLDDILYFGTGKSPATMVAFNSDFEQIALYQSSKKTMQRYAHVHGTCLLPLRDEIVLQYGGFFMITDLAGNIKQQTGERYVGGIYNDLAFLPSTKELVGGGLVGGDNTLYFYNLTKANWTYAEFSHEARLKEVDDNINTLYTQTLNYKAPSYQKKSDKSWMMMGKGVDDNRVNRLDFNSMLNLTQEAWHEDFDRKDIVAAIGKDALKRDKRPKYKLTQADIISMARDHERKGEPFTVWAGHVTDPFYMSIETLEKILEVAPNTCYGYIYAEMSSTTDPRSHYFVDEYIPRLATALRKNGKAKLYFRYKNVFWAASSHLDLWKRLFFSGKYNDILVPASEDTSNRTQDMNFTGRVGMFCGDYVDDFAMRLVDDNPTSWRPYTPGGQSSVSPYLRQGVMLAAYGARVGIIFPNHYIEEPGMDVLYALMKSGVLPIVEKEDILSISSWHLTKEIDEHLLEEIDNHHHLSAAKVADTEAVFSVAHMQWAGASIPEWDYSKAALGVDYRWLNYMPVMPYGMVPIAPSEMAPMLDAKGTPYTVSNLKHGWRGDTAVPAPEFGKDIRTAAVNGSKEMPILVEGASWSAVRLDDNHTRIIMADQGYVDPQERQVTIHFQNRSPKSATNILTKKAVEINKNVAEVSVPAGSLLFIDIAY